MHHGINVMVHNNKVMVQNSFLVQLTYIEVLLFRQGSDLCLQRNGVAKQDVLSLYFTLLVVIE